MIKLQKFIELPNSEKSALIRGLFWMILAQMLVYIAPLQFYRKSLLGHLQHRDLCDVDLHDPNILKVRRSIAILSNHIPWKPKCFVQAITAKRMLKAEGIGSILCLGLQRSATDMKAHAWLRIHDQVIVGQRTSGDFKTIAEFH